MNKFGDPKKEAVAYLEEKRIHSLFELLLSKIMFHKPEDPQEFLLEELTRIHELKLNKQPITAFEVKDLEVMYTAYDVTGKGHVELSQYNQALKVVGVSEPKYRDKLSDKITKKEFVDGM